MFLFFYKAKDGQSHHKGSAPAADPELGLNFTFPGCDLMA